MAAEADSNERASKGNGPDRHGHGTAPGTEPMRALAYQADWPAPARVKAWVSTRDGGVSSAPYSTLNLGTHVGDEPGAVAENRRRLAAALELPADPNWLTQVHGCRVVDLDEPWSGPADGAVTGRTGVVCAVLTADCLPVLLADRGGSRIGIAHAGWRGLAAGVLEAVVAAMETPPEELLVWLGPAIGPAAYEVGDDVRTAFADADADADADEGVAADATVVFRPNQRGRWQADLYALARMRLQRLGVTSIHGGGSCTFSEPERFFSHRREAPCGRMASLIWLADEGGP